MLFVPLNFVLNRLYDLINYEVGILRVDEKEEIEGLQRDLEFIESYLKDIDELQRHKKVSHVLQTKIKHLIDIIYKIEKFLDAIASVQKGQRIQSSCFQEFKEFFSCTSSNLFIRKHRFVDDITRIREYLSDTLRRPVDQYNLLPTNNSQVTYKKRLQTKHNIIQEEIIVGLDEDVRDLVAKFIGEQGERGANAAIVGMGGSGKTTLARTFYNHQKIKEVFPRRAWVCVSQEWNTEDLLVKIGALLGIKLPEGSIRDPAVVQHAVDNLQKFLGEYSCLVVLDDVWEREPLDELIPTLLSGNGRVLITTRNQGIIHFPNIPRFYIHNTRPLTPEESWKLFSRIVCNVGGRNFGDGDPFEILGREMIKKCDGLPLAIVALAGLLGTKSSLHEWESISKDDVISRIMEDRNESVKKILELSYFDLSYYLKPCFLYLGTFKEDEEIDVDILINLWIDEGLLGSYRRWKRRPEDVAKDLLEELVQRCMVEVVSRDYADAIKTIRIHDSIRDLCIDKAREFNFFQVSSPSTRRTIAISPTCHRAIVFDRESISLADPHLGTFIFRERDLGIKPPLDVKELPGDSIPFGMLKQVRVLYLDGVDLQGDSVQQIAKMVLLRYLRFGFYIKNLRNVAFIKELRNLQTLIYNRSLWGHAVDVKWPVNMVSSLEELRVLCLQAEVKSDVISRAISGVGKLKRLQTLHAQAGEWLVQELHTIINNTDLRELRLNKICNQHQVDVLYECVSESLTHLESLRLELAKGSGLGFDLQKMKLGTSQKSLKCLHLCGKIIKRPDEPRPDWLSFPPNLLSLSLVETEIEKEEDLKEAISELTKLRELSLLQGSYKGEYLTFNVPLLQLQRLTLEFINDLKACSIIEGCLPQLQELTINACNNLGGIPAGIDTIRTLKLLKISSMVDHKFLTRLEKRKEGATEGGEDFHLVQHIPNITYPRLSFEASRDRYD